MRRLVALVVLPALGLGCFIGCGSTSGGWTKPGATEEQVGRDTLDCRNDASTTVAGREGPRQVVNQDRYRRCMTDRGYTGDSVK